MATKSQRITDGELFKRVYTSTHEAADVLAPMVDYAGLTPQSVTALRNLLREAYCAAQELRSRLKVESRGVDSGTPRARQTDDQLSTHKTIN